MEKYLVVLPTVIPSHLFSCLRGTNSTINASLNTFYATLDRFGLTEADTPAEAVRNLITRQTNPRTVEVRSLLKMFGNYAWKCVSIAPSLPITDASGEPLDKRTARTFYGMEVAVDMADCLGRLDKRAYDSRDFHSKAFTLLRAEENARAA